MNIAQYLFSFHKHGHTSRPKRPAAASGNHSTGGRRWLVGTLLWLLMLPGLQAQAAIKTVMLSPDVTMKMPFTGGGTFSARGSEWFRVDPATGLTNGASSVLSGSFTERAKVNLDAYDGSLGAFSIDIDVVVDTGDLPFFMRKGEIYNGNGTKLFDPVAAGLPANTNVDAISVDPATGDLLFSIAQYTANPSTNFILPSDVIRWNGTSLSLFFDGNRVPRELNLDALHVLSDGRILMSFDTAGTIDGIGFRDEELMLYDPLADTFALHTITAGFASDWFPADLDALYVVELTDAVFADGFE